MALTTQYNQLKIYEELGSGSFGKVYRAYDPELKKYVAIKMIEMDTSADLEEVLLELKFLSELRCEQVIQYFHASLHDSVLFVTMEFGEAGSCAQLLRKVQGFRENSTAYILNQILKGLVYIHSQDKIHRDLKAANILISDNYKVKIADFGVSAQLSRTLPERNSFMGTPYWMAPEIIAAESYNTAVDVWSLGIVAIELLLGKPPFRRLSPNEAMRRIVRGSPPEPPAIAQGFPISKALTDLISQCLKKDPAKRPTCRALLSTRYMQAHSKPPQEFKRIVDSAVAARAVKYGDIKPCTLDDLEHLAPAKSTNSRQVQEEPEWNPDQEGSFDLSFEPLQRVNCNIQQPSSSPPMGKYTAHQHQNQHQQYPPQQPVQQPMQQPMHPPRAPNHKPPLRAGLYRPASAPMQSPPMQSQAARPGQCAAEQKPRKAVKDDVATQWIRTALSNVQKRTKVSSAQARILKLQAEIEELNADYDGFSTAMLQEIWRVMVNSKNTR